MMYEANTIAKQGQHILLIIGSLRGGGAERVTLNLARKMLDIGCQVTILLLRPGIEYQIDYPLRIEILPRRRLALPKFLRSLDRLLIARSMRNAVARIERSFGPINLTLSSLSPPDRLLALAKLPNTYFMIHNTESQRLQRKGRFVQWRKKRIFRHTYNGKNIVTVSAGAAEDLLGPMGVKPGTIQTIYNPVDITWIKEQASEYVPAMPEAFLVHVGRFHRQKRHDLLLRAYAKSGVEGKLLLLGKGSRQAESDLRMLAQDLGITDKVVFAGFQANPYPWIKKARGLVLASDYEGLPTVILEALACGTPVISTDCPSGPAEILTGNLAGCLVPVGDEAALAGAIAQLWATPPVVESAVLDRFTPNTVVAQYLKLCKEPAASLGGD
jgi:glycosyltransferase involved in cell wall biosynthesis